MACLLLVMGTAASMPFAYERLLRALGASPWWTPAVAFTFYGKALTMGFLPFLAAIPVALYTLSEFLALFPQQKLGHPERNEGPPHARWHHAKLAALTLATYLLHVQMFAWLFALASAFSALHVAQVRPNGRVDVQRGLRSMLFTLPTLMVAVLWLGRGKTQTHHADAVDAITWTQPHDWPNQAYTWAHDGFAGPTDEMLGAVVWLCILAVFVQLKFRPPTAQVASLPGSWLPAAVTLALFLGLPERVGFGRMLSVRYACLFLPLALLCVPNSRASRKLASLRALVGIAAVGMLGFATAQFARASNALGDLDAVLRNVPNGARVLQLNFDTSKKFTDFPPWLHVLAYRRMQVDLTDAFSFAELPHWPVALKPGNLPPPKPDYWDLHPCFYRAADDGPFYDHVLSYGERGYPFAGPSFDEVARNGPWALYRKVKDPKLADLELKLCQEPGHHEGQ
jgi:hypothetical protein